MVGKIDSFIDVIGIVSAISDLLKVRLPARTQDSDKRNLQVINIDLGEQMPALRVMSANDDQYNTLYNMDAPQTIDAAFLNSTDPNEFLCSSAGLAAGMAATVRAQVRGTKRPDFSTPIDMISTVTIMRLASEHWRFLSCQLCHKKAFQAVNAFVCSNKRCNCTTATPRYEVHVIGADTTGEVEFVYFATVAEQIIGKRLEVVMRSARPLAVLVVPIVNFCRKNTNMVSSSSIE